MNQNNLNSLMDLYNKDYNFLKHQMIPFKFNLIENHPLMYRFLIFLIIELPENNNSCNQLFSIQIKSINIFKHLHHQY
jgi:hypothetical protein